MDVQTPNDDSDDNEDDEPDNTAGKRQRQTYATANTIRKEMTKQMCRCIKEATRKKESKNSS